MKTNILLIISTLAMLIFFTATNISAQIDVKGKVEDKTTQRADQRVDEGIDKTLDGIENGVKGVFKKKDKKDKDETENEETKNEMVGGESDSVDKNEDQQEETPAIAIPDDKPKLESYTKYDFVPGDQILFFEDFSQDAIGDFPALWTSDGSGEVKKVSIAEGKWFHMNGEDAIYGYLNQIAFPKDFIIEFDIIPDAVYNYGIQLTLYNDVENRELNSDLYPGSEGLHIEIKYDQWNTLGYSNETEDDFIHGKSTTKPVVREQVNHVIIWVQNRRTRIYHDGAKALDIPTSMLSGTSFNKIRFSGWDRTATPMITNFKITTASPDMRSKLLTEGKLVSYGIYFDSGKDAVKPESYGSVNEIANVLKENPAVKIMIVGHTDSDGDDAMNLDLSKRRAANVKNYLVKEFGISADRISTDGKGESQSLVANTSVENKAKNRRVEFIKL